MDAEIAVSKIGKYASSESGDTLEMIERPTGGLSFVLADGQRSGKSAKAISNVATRKAISLLADGVRDGAAARAASDYLYTYRSGKVLATLNILSLDLQSQTMVIVRNNPAPAFVLDNGTLIRIDSPSIPIGTRRDIRPDIHEYPLKVGLGAVIFSDGLTHAGDRTGKKMEVENTLLGLLEGSPIQARSWADELLEHAVELDQGRPTDDITILIAAIHPTSADDVRRLSVRVPLKDYPTSPL
jgi:serine phosphatase RsbU (regulator of sigma subunit)